MHNSGNSGSGGLQLESLTRRDVEDFLFLEARLLDEWRLDEWMTLFTQDATYAIPTTDQPEGTSESYQMLIADSYNQIAARVRRLKSKNAHAENPHSRTRRLITNVELIQAGEGVADVRASFLVFRIKYNVNAWFVGQYRHRLVLDENGELRFLSRSAILDQEMLEVDGRVSIIL